MSLTYKCRNLLDKLTWCNLYWRKLPQIKDSDWARFNVAPNTL